MTHEFRNQRRALCVLACAGLHLVGCNALLNIDEPSALLLDGGQSFGGSGGSGGSPDGGFDYDASIVPDGGGPLGDRIHTHARWPMPNPLSTGLSNPEAYSVDEAGVVIDNVTQLQWQRAASATSMSWIDAARLCENLALAGGGFRLPSRIELLSLLDLTQSNSAIDAVAFPGTPAEGFWSGSYIAGPPADAWGVNFGFSTSIVFQDDVNHERRVRCVRSDDGISQGGGSTADNGVVDDPATGLHWQQAGLQTNYAWDAALAYCTNLELQGMGWRLPTIKELHTLVDETRENPSADTLAFPGIAASFYWTSSQPKNFVNLAWTVGFDHGLDVFRGTTSTAYVRCVR
jgi:hypothetical protein